MLRENTMQLARFCDKINTIIYHKSHDLPFKRDPSTDIDLAGQP